MKYLLDTNVCVDYIGGRYRLVNQRIQDCSPRQLGLSSVVVAELRYGADKSTLRLRNHARIDILVRDIPIFDFDLAAAETFGRLRADLERRGETVGPYDMMIAAHALALDYVLVSDNEREFRRVNGLTLENWRI